MNKFYIKNKAVVSMLASITAIISCYFYLQFNGGLHSDALQLTLLIVLIALLTIVISIISLIVTYFKNARKNKT